MARPCSICTHPQRAEIDKEIVSGKSFRTIAGGFDVSESALKRHKKHIATTVIETERQKAVSGTARMLKELSRGFDSLARAADKAEQDGDHKMMAQLWKTAADLAIPLLKISGDLPGGGTTINIFENPQFNQFIAIIAEELPEEVKDRVVRRLDEIRSR